MTTADRRHDGRAARTNGASKQERIELLRAFYRRRRRQKVVGWCLVGLAVVIAVQHWLRHVDTINVAPFLSGGLQDLLVGYPTAAVLAIVALVLLGQSDELPTHPRARRR